MSQDEHDEFADLSEEDQRIARLIKAGNIPSSATKPEPGEIARLGYNSSKGAVQLTSGDEFLWDVRRMNKAERDWAKKKLLIHHYREEGKAVATAIIHEAFGMWPSPRNDQYPDKTTPLGIVAFFVGSPTVSKCCGKQNVSRVVECSRSFMADGIAKDCAGLLLCGALEQQQRWDVVVSYADPMQGHTGSLYKQCGFVYTGLSEPFWEWQELAHPERNHQVVEQQMRDEKAAHTFDPTCYRQVPRMQKQRWVWFRPGFGLTSSDLQTWAVESQLLPTWVCCEHPDLAWHQKHQS